MTMTYMHKKTTGVDLLLDLPLADLRALADDATERVERARLQQDRVKAQRWQCCVLWAQILMLNGVTEMNCRAFNSARKKFLAL